MSKASKKSVAPGSVVILLSGSYAGCRAIALKELPQGQVLICGPHSINRCPVLAVPKSRVIVTSTKIDVTSVKKIDSVSVPSKKGKENVSKVCIEVSEEISNIIKKDNTLKSYMKSRFNLNKCFRIPAHELVF